MKRTVLVLTLAIIWIISFSGASRTIHVKAHDPWDPAPLPGANLEIQGSGDVVELVETAKIRRNGTVYLFTEDVNGSIAVLGDNIVIDGAGHTLRGNGTGTGLFLQGRNNVTIKNLQVSNFTVGVDLTWWWPLGWTNRSNVLQGNIITNNKYGITLNLVKATILENIISNNSIGIGCFSSSLLVSGNNISNNSEGIQIIISSGSVCHNNFINNTLQANFDTESPYSSLPSTISWHNDSEKEGNYWSDYNGTDLNGDGTGDIPYFIAANNTDQYPLVNRVLIPDFSEAENLTVTESQPFPKTLIAATTVIITIAMVGAALLIYFGKIRKNERELDEPHV